ncbi:unnamed protein product [Adineta steineri]|uniref:NAD(P)(+)--arginine ADP-ribosyltransferase n=1 Tax=Adineta steineri TaxID=433720 RepID=A0A814R8E8_9BILA|nr:unnamed protein product [Adineta steineri]
MMNENICWYYKSNINPWPNISTTDINQKEWSKYRDIEIDLIEEAYQKNESYVLLDRYRIDLKQFIQIKLTDETKQRPIKRQTDSTKKECLREYRFGSSIPLISDRSLASLSYGSSDCWCPFLTAWLKSSAGQQAFIHFSKCIEACAQGIVREAALYGNHSNAEAAYMAEKIRQCSNKSRVEISKQCISFYTKDSFLYYALNDALRKQDHTKIETFGPLCYLIRNYSCLEQDYIGIVYRGLQLDYTDIDLYKQDIGQWKTWPAFTSTSKDRQLAEMFGNTLIIIEVTKVKLSSPRAYDIAHISNYPHEQEVLMPAGVSFQILKVEQDLSQKYIIYVKV